jgi:light-regulated signal transduction histidine kinase (bacteriophytochrome)
MVRYALQKAPDVQFDTHLEDALEDATVKEFKDDIRVLLEAGVKVQNLLNSTYNFAMIAVLRELVKEHTGMVRALRKIYKIQEGRIKSSRLQVDMHSVYTSHTLKIRPSFARRTSFFLTDY